MTPAIVIVTGASRGLGRALAATVPFVARVLDVSRSGADGLEHLRADLADPGGWGTLGDALDRELAGFTGERVTLIHNAGTLTPMGFAGEVDPDGYAANVLLNSAAPQVIGHRFLAAVRDLACRRELVLITSGAARSVYPGWSSYGAGKAAVDQWVRTVGAEQRERGGVTVLALAPGVLATDMQAEIRAQDPTDFPRVDRFRRLHEEGALRDPHDAARQVWSALDQGHASGSVLDLREL